MPRFRLLLTANSFRLVGKRYFPGDQIELTPEQANRLNPDLFAKIETPMLEVPEPTVTSASVLQDPESAQSQKQKTVAKKPGSARKPKL